MIIALLFYNNETKFAAMTTSERNALVERHVHFNSTVVQPRALMMINRAFQPTNTARTVWPHGEETTITEGPFDRPDLSLSGFYLIDCEDMAEATELAAQYPMPAGLGCVEVRPALQGWDYAPSINLDATRPERVWGVYSDVNAWPQWMPGVETTALSGPCIAGSTGKIQLKGQQEAHFTIESAEPCSQLTLRLDFPDADASLGLEYTIDPLPRGAVRVTHRATVPRAILDTLGTDFSGTLNTNLRAGLRAISSRLRSEGPETTP